MTMAKGLTSSYLPLGAVAMRHEIAEQFETKMFYGGLTYSSHPVSLAAALATISRLRGGRPDRERRPARRRSCASHHERAGGEAPERRARPATSACSGSSTSSAAAIRGRR